MRALGAHAQREHCARGEQPKRHRSARDSNPGSFALSNFASFIVSPFISLLNLSLTFLWSLQSVHREPALAKTASHRQLLFKNTESVYFLIAEWISAMYPPGNCTTTASRSSVL